MYLGPSLDFRPVLMPQRECRSLWKVLVGISGDTIRGLLLRGKEHFSKTKMLSEESL